MVPEILISPCGNTCRTASPRVFEDPDNPGKYRAYIIGSHDLRMTSYCGPDIRMWSAPVEDLSSWRDEGPIFTYPIEGQWDVMYAPDLVEVRRRDGTKEYYLYPHSRGRNREAMVAKGSRPGRAFYARESECRWHENPAGQHLGFRPLDLCGADYRQERSRLRYWFQGVRLLGFPAFVCGPTRS